MQKVSKSLLLRLENILKLLKHHNMKLKKPTFFEFRKSEIDYKSYIYIY